ncbi:MAG: alpha/beta family hydrolase [Acidimicrobiia bacterium]|jgi:uncharacterized protein
MANPGRATIPWSSGRAVAALVDGSGEAVVVLAHGAGTDQRHPMITALRHGLAAGGVTAVTFDYPFTTEGRRRPDQAEVLLACHRAVLGWVRAELGEALVAGGRSMGGRMASMLAAEGDPMAGLVLYGYPLHPAGRPDRLRVEHLSRIACPMLFFQGSRDALARAELFDRHVRPHPTAGVVDLDGADHAFRGREWDPDRLTTTLVGETLAWLGRIGPGRLAPLRRPEA